jgi:hypothetical protein
MDASIKSKREKIQEMQAEISAEDWAKIKLEEDKEDTDLELPELFPVNDGAKIKLEEDEEDTDPKMPELFTVNVGAKAKLEADACINQEAEGTSLGIPESLHSHDGVEIKPEDEDDLEGIDPSVPELT